METERSEIVSKTITKLLIFVQKSNKENFMELYEAFKLWDSFALQEGKETEADCIFIIFRAYCFCLFGKLYKKYDTQIIDEIFQNLIFLWGLETGQTGVDYSKLEELSLFSK